MGSTLRNRRWFRLLCHVCRTLFAVTFILSGFVKAIDPWGTALNIGNYLAAYGFSDYDYLVMPFSIWLCGAEFMMGCMLLFKVRIRLVSIFALVSMTFFTLLTFLSATFIPVEDCGCFGEFIKLTPWQTFAKNLILLPMAVCIWWRYRPDSAFSFSRLELLLAVLFFVLSMSIGTLSYRHLPLIDMLPYHKGVNIAEAMEEARNAKAESEIVLVYRNRRTGRLREFSLNDRSWQNTARWEWVETRVDEETVDSVRPMILEFHIADHDRDVTDSLLNVRGRMYMLCINDADDLSADCRHRMTSVVKQADSEGSAVICITPKPMDADRHSVTLEEGCEVSCYNIDFKTMITLLRTTAGYVCLEDGTIVDKRNCRDIDF